MAESKRDHKLTANGNHRTLAWKDKAGIDLTVGTKVVEPIKGVVKARCTRPEKDGARTEMVGVIPDKPFARNGRNVKCPTFPAAECLAAKVTPKRKARGKAAADDRAVATA